MRLDVVEIGGRLERVVVPIKILHPLVDRGVPMPDVAYVALEVAYVDGVEADLLANLRLKSGKRNDRLTIVTQRRMSHSVSLSPTMYCLPVKSFSTLSRDSKSWWTASSYADWVVAKPDLYTPSTRHKSVG